MAVSLVDPSGDLTLRPDPAHFASSYGAGIGSAGGLLLGTAALVKVLAHPESVPAILACLGLLAVALVGFITGYRIVGSVKVRDGVVTKTGWFGVRRFDVKQAAHAYKLSLGGGVGAPYRLFIVVSTDGRCLLPLSGMVWRDAQLDALGQRLGLPGPQQWEGRSDSYRRARHLCPGGGLPFMIAHPVWFGFLATPPVLAVIVGLVAFLNH